ncbi:hypothetical protein [uncultured Shewanella sp.]|uniref:hypothetical protein n=1 Tax=uncultured Shewanella sp. TaxID=173975 RepID=UPI0026167DCA|nr:hypothetical protein [uncultured Shewanella sp.]
MQYIKFIAIALSLLFIGAYSNVRAVGSAQLKEKNDDTTQYQIVIDAGKDKTKFFLYQYSQYSETPTGIQALNEQVHYPGIADIPILELSDYLDTLFTPTLAHKLQQLMIESNNHSPPLTRIQFYSTEGMRLLSPQERQSKNTFITLWLTNWVRTYDLKVTPQQIESRTLSGTEEGAYTWVATNYAENHFKGTLSGVAKLGPISSQITYLDPNLTNVTVTVGNNQYPLTSKGFPLGQEVVAKKLAKIDACFLTGYTKTSNGDYFSCKAQLKRLLRQQVNIPVPNATDISHYNLLSNFYYTARFFGIENDYSLNALENQAEKFCNLDWETAKAKYHNVNQKYLANYCLGAAYQSTLLHYNYHISEPQQLNPVNEFNHQEITWPMGVILTKQYQEVY